MRRKVLPVMKPFGVDDKPKDPVLGQTSQVLGSNITLSPKKQPGGAISPAAFTVRAVVMWSLVEDIML